MSRWTTPIWWACSRASAAWMPSRPTERKNSWSPREPFVVIAACKSRRVSSRDGVTNPAVGSPLSEPGSRGVDLPANKSVADRWIVSGGEGSPGVGLQRVDDLGQRLALDIIHGIEMHGTLAANREDGDDMGVLERGRCPGLIEESLKLTGIEDSGKREYFQRNPTAQRDLLGFVHDPHPAPANLTEDAKIAKTAEGAGACSGWSALARLVPQLVQSLQRGHHLFDLVGELWVLREDATGIRRSARSHCRLDFLGQ